MLERSREAVLEWMCAQSHGSLRLDQSNAATALDDSSSGSPVAETPDSGEDPLQQLPTGKAFRQCSWILTRCCCLEIPWAPLLMQDMPEEALLQANCPSTQPSPSLSPSVAEVQSCLTHVLIRCRCRRVWCGGLHLRLLLPGRQLRQPLRLHAAQLRKPRACTEANPG